MLKHPILLLIAAICTLLFIMMIIIAGFLTPNYSHISQYVSELGADQAPYAFLMNYLGIIPFGLGILAISLNILSLDVKRQKTKIITTCVLSLSAIGFVLAGAYPCDAGCSFDAMSTSAIIHNMSAFSAFLLAIIGVALLSLVDSGQLKPLVSVVMATFMILFLGLMMYLGVDSDYIGLAQRLFLGTLCVWVVFTSLKLFLNSRHDFN